MVTTVKAQSSNTAKRRQEQAASVPEPKQISKAGQWKRDNPNGIFIVTDWRAVNK